MPEIRKNFITGEHVIIAPGRSKRPNDFMPPAGRATLPERSEKCPFCPGNEGMTPPDTYMVPSGGGWSVRCVPNKFSALSPDGDLWKRFEPLHHVHAGVGPHEVIIETPRHDLTLALMGPEGVASVLRAYSERFRAFHADPRVEHVILFKNHGPAAGTSLEHPHSQIVGLPMTPFQVRHRSEEALRFFLDSGGCVVCRTIEDELSGGRVVERSERFVAVVPYAALSPYHLWILPLRHSGSFSDCTEAELDDLAGVLRSVLARVHHALGDPDYNLVLRSASPAEAGARHLHWYIAVVPRVTKAAGFELGTGMYINPSLPEDSAMLLREARTAS